jgi:PST family polysaccharide transporter
VIRKLKTIAKTELIKTFLFSTVSTFFKSASALVLNKVVAVYIGPIGVALVGQFTNFFGIITNIGSGGIETGVIKYVAENQGNETNTRKLISTAAFAMTFCSLLTALVVFLFASYFSNLIFKSQEYKFILYLVSLFLVLVSIKGLLMAVLNGHKEVIKYTWVNIITSLSTLVLSLLLVAKYQLTGVLIALVVCQFIGFIITLFFTVKYHWFKIAYFFQYFDKKVLKNLSAYSIMTLVGSFSFPFTLFLVRDYIGNHLSWKEAGYWQGVWMISEGYLVFITAGLSFYYLPRLSEITDKKEFRSEIIRSSKIAIPIVSAMALFIFLVKRPLVNILFTSEFKPMLPLFKYQLLGDVIRIAGWIFSYQIISKGMTRLFIFTAVIFNFSFVILSVLFLRSFGLEGVSLAFCVNAFLYLIFMLFAFRKSLFIGKNEAIGEIPNYQY